MEPREHRDENERIRKLVALDKTGLPADGGPRFNRLIFSTSPYLLQHAENPVDWYPWGKEAFARAAAEEKVVFVSIGYATCHWCHVMAHESFEDPDVAAVFNRSFVCIKVDREERPDIDEQYMAVAQVMTGSGGWPLNIFMTPDQQPFFAATYVPKEPRQGMPGIVQLLARVAELWQTERQKLAASSAATLEAVSAMFKPRPGSLPDRSITEAAFRQLSQSYDPFWGGFGTAPKFPMPHYLSFLLRYGWGTGDEKAVAMVEQTLRMLRQGGIWDHIGGGFHRYATDREWLVPHFEKMLYDQALLALAGIEAFQATGNPFYLKTAEEVFEYVLREMVSPRGGFFSAQDADTAGEEGAFYLWTPGEVAAVLGPADADLFCRLYDVTESGNFEGRNILHLLVAPEVFAAREGIAPERFAADLERWRRSLLAARDGRIRPLRDEKVLTAWNGLMIAALARGYGVTGNERYVAAATAGAEMVAAQLTSSQGRLLRSHHLDKADIPGFLEDYAFYIWGLIELHQATLEPRFLDGARSLSGEMLRLFSADDGGGLYETAADAERLPLRQQNAFDGALPSSNGVAAANLLRLGRILEDEELTMRGKGIVRAFMGEGRRQPVAFLNLLAAAADHEGPEVLVTLSGGPGEVAAYLRTLYGTFIPGMAFRAGGEGVPSAAVCAATACRPPVGSPEKLARLLDELQAEFRG